MKIITSEDFNASIANGVCLVDFYADWCGPCQMLGPILESVDAKVDANIFKVDVDSSQEIAAEYGVMSLPTMLLFKDGQKVDQKVGALQEDVLIEWINSVK